MKAINLSCTHEQNSIFENISFELYSSELLLVEGRNGSGKSSLLRLLAGLATPSQGEILWENDIQNIHYLSHANGFKLGLTVLENLKLLEQLAMVTNSNFDDVLQQLDLYTCKKMLVRHLSAGQKRRLALAKLFLFPRLLWILDEPLTTLDIQTQTIFLSALESHLQNRGMAIVSSHHPISFNKLVIKNLRLSA